MAKKKNDSLMHEVQRLDAFMGIIKVLEEKGVNYEAIPYEKKMRISDYIYAAVDMWNEVKGTNGYKYIKTLADVSREWFIADYAQVMGMAHRITVLNTIPFANTKKVTLVYA